MVYRLREPVEHLPKTILPSRFHLPLYSLRQPEWPPQVIDGQGYGVLYIQDQDAERSRCETLPDSLLPHITPSFCVQALKCQTLTGAPGIILLLHPDHGLQRSTATQGYSPRSAQSCSATLRWEVILKLCHGEHRD